MWQTAASASARPTITMAAVPGAIPACSLRVPTGSASPCRPRRSHRPPRSAPRAGRPQQAQTASGRARGCRGCHGHGFSSMPVSTIGTGMEAVRVHPCRPRRPALPKDSHRTEIAVHDHAGVAAGLSSATSPVRPQDGGVGHVRAHLHPDRHPRRHLLDGRHRAQQDQRPGVVSAPYHWSR